MAPHSIRPICKGTHSSGNAAKYHERSSRGTSCAAGLSVSVPTTRSASGMSTKYMSGVYQDHKSPCPERDADHHVTTGGAAASRNTR